MSQPQCIFCANSYPCTCITVEKSGRHEINAEDRTTVANNQPMIVALSHVTFIGPHSGYPATKARLSLVPALHHIRPRALHIPFVRLWCSAMNVNGLLIVVAPLPLEVIRRCSLCDFQLSLKMVTGTQVPFPS